MRATTLRHLFVTVQEREPERYTWVLLESAGTSVPVLDEIASSPRALDSYSQAVREGAEALAKLGRRSRSGPRSAERNMEFVSAAPALMQQA